MFGSIFNETVFALVGLNIIFAQSFYITYTAGQLSFGHAAFATVGAYTAGLLTTRYGFGLPFALLASLVAGFISGILVAIPALRTRYIYLAILTFGVLQIVTYVFENWQFVGGVHGIPGMFGIEVGEIIVAAICVTAAAWWLERSRLGLAMRAVKKDEPVAALLGVNTVGLRLVAFGLGSAVAGFGGALYGHYNFFVDPQTFGLAIAINMVFFTIVGGTQVWIGPVIGSIVLTLVPELLRGMMANIDQWRPAIYAAVIVLMLAVRPEGLVSRRNLLSVARKLRRAPSAPAAAAPAAAPAGAAPSTGASLALQGVGKKFGGVSALDDVTIDIPAGATWGVIGPNGAGKTSLFNVVTGVYRPSAGRIVIGGEDVTSRSPTARARRGVARTFQNIRLFSEMTVLENVLIGQHRNAGLGLLPFADGGAVPERRLREQAEFLLAELGLGDVRHRFAVELPYATQRRVEIARALALSPRILLLDEPTAGMDPAESAQIVDVIRNARRVFGPTIILIEHDMSVVMNVCERITVLNFGRRIAEGTTAEIQADQAVRDAYLGAPE